jgi:hypothetical protein
MAQENAGEKVFNDWFYYIEVPLIKIEVKDQVFLASPFGILGFYFSEYQLFEKAFSELYFNKDFKGVVEKDVVHPVRLKEPLSGEEYSVTHSVFTASALIKLSYYKPSKELPIVTNVLLYDSYSKLEKTIEFRGVIRGLSVRLPIEIVKESPSSTKLLVNYNGKTYVMYYSIFLSRIKDIFLPEDFALFDLIRPKTVNFHARALRSKEERKIANPYSQNYDIMSFLQENQK